MRFRFCRQKDSMQCGVAALAMACSCLGKNIPDSELRKICHPTNEGVSLKGISDAAEKMGLQSKSFLCTPESLQKIPLPLILHWNQNHFVLLYAISRNPFSREIAFHIADPAKGKIKLKESEFTEHWIPAQESGTGKGVAMAFEPTDAFQYIDVTQYAKPKHSLKFILSYLKPYRSQMWRIAAGLLFACILQLIFPFLTQAIVDIGIHDKDISFIWLVILGEFMIVLGRTVIDFVRARLMLRVSMKVNVSLVSDFFMKLLKLPMSFFDTKLMGDLLQRIGDHTRVKEFFTGQVINVSFSLLSFFIFGIVLLIYNYLIFIIFVLGSVAYALWIAMFLEKRKILDYSLFEVRSKDQNNTYQFVTSMQEIKLQSCEERRKDEWEAIQSEMFDVQMQSLNLKQKLESGSIFINEIKNIIITVTAATAVINGQMTLGAMLAIQYIIGQLNSPVSQLMSFIYTLQDVRISLERINEIHDSNDEDEGRFVKSLDGDKSIVLDDISFKYDSHAIENTLSDISFNIPEGKVTAIVGASGSGKTTLLKLILGYYPVNSGRIVISGRDISDYNPKWWRRQCGVVMQDGVIFSESIARNIAVDDNDIDFDRMENAALIANIHEYVSGLPLKYNTIIGRDGVGLSQGQKQRILIARAVYKNPSFIFLDEATNALDAKNEKTIVKNLSNFYSGRTVIVVAHRLSTVKHADQIVVMDSGRIVETGIHASLIEKRGAYFNLIKNQLEIGM